MPKKALMESIKQGSAVLAAVLLGLAASAAVYAEEGGSEVKAGKCRSSGVFSTKLITKVCWDCTMPIRASGITITGKKRKDNKPARASKKALCLCEDTLGVPRPGIMSQFWEPYRMMEIERLPGCMGGLGGTRFPFNPGFLGGVGQIAEDGQQQAQSFKHLHYYSMPLMLMLDMFVPASCNPDGYIDFDIMFVTEVDPTWNNDTLAYFTMPEAALLVTPFAAAACIPDAISSSVAKMPLQELFWCAGSWGTMYPTSGNTEGMDIITVASLQKTRMLLQMHRRGFVRRSIGDDAICGGVIDPTLPKYMYQFTLFDPVPEVIDSHVIGETVLRWGLMKTIPAVGEDPTFVIWRWQDCCQTKSSGSLTGGS